MSLRHVPGIGREGISVIFGYRTGLISDYHRVGFILSSIRCCSGSTGWESLPSSGQVVFQVQVEDLYIICIYSSEASF